MGRTYETAIKISAQLASTFKNVVGGAASSLSDLEKSAARLKNLDRSTERFALLQGKVADAQRRFDTASRALESMRAAGARLGVTGKALEKFLADDTAAVKKLSDRLDKAKAAALAAGTALAAAGVDTRKLADEQQRLGHEIAATERRMKAMASAEAARKRVFGDRGLRERIFGDPNEARLDKFNRQAAGLARTAAGIGAAGIGAGVGLFALLKRAAEAGDAVDDAAGRLGIGGAALQAFQAQAKMAGAESEDVNISVGKLAVNIGKVLAAKKKGGGGQGAAFGPVEGLTIFGKEGGGGGAGNEDPFKRLGLSVKQLKDLKPEQQVEAVADKIAGLKTQAEQAAAAAAVFGKGGVKLLPLLREGSAGIRRFREEGVRTGRFMSDDATKAASDFNDALEALTGRGVNVLVNALGGTLLPVGTKTFKELTAWVTANQDKIREWAEKAKIWIEGTAIPAVKSAGIWFLDTAQKIGSGVQKVADLVGGFDNLVIAIAALKATPLIKTSLEIVTALGKMVLAVSGYGDALAIAKAKQDAFALGVGGVALGAAAAVGYSFYKVAKTGQDNIDQLEEAKKVANRRYEQMHGPQGPADAPSSGRRVVRGPAVVAEVGSGGNHFAPGAIQVTVQGGDLGNPADRKKNAEELGRQVADELQKHERNRRRVAFREAPAT